jgi:hypothetical protein
MLLYGLKADLLRKSGGLAASNAVAFDFIIL